MTSFNTETTLVPLMMLIVLGWGVGRWRSIDVRPISTLLIYAVAPVVAFGTTAQLAFHGRIVLLPFIVYMLAAFSGLTSFALGRVLLKKKELRFLLPEATGCGNNGYFGLPVAMALFPPGQVGIYFLIIMGTSLFEATFGYYFVGRGNMSVMDALKRTAGMPIIYAITAGLFLSAFHVRLDPGLVKLCDVAKGCYVTLGMMIIGLALARHKKLSRDFDFIALVMFGKYVLWAIAVSGFVWLDGHVLRIYGTSVYTMIAILVITPTAANTAAFAAQLDFKPQQAATVVFLTTLLSFAALPFTLPLLFTFAQH